MSARPDRLAVYPLRTRYAAEVAEILDRLGHRGPVLYVDNLPDGPEPPRVDPVIDAAAFHPNDAEQGIIVPVFPPGIRHRLVTDLRAAGATCFPALIDPTAVVARSASIGDGTIVNALAVVASGTDVGAFVSVNRSVSVGHDCTIADFVSFGPGAVLTGHVTVQPGAFVGAGAVTVPGVTIGANAIVGAGAVVTADVAPGTVVVGNPAKAIKTTDGHGGGVPTT